MTNFGVRLRVRATKGFTSDEASIPFEIDGMSAELCAPDGKTLRDTPWFVLKVRGFQTQETAQLFGNKLKTALLVASIRRFWGVDVGEDKATAAFFKGVSDALAAEGMIVRPNIHGLDVYEDLPGTRWIWIDAQGRVSTNPNQLIDEVLRMFGSVPLVVPERFDAVRLLNEAFLSQEPAAQLVLAIAAVELLAQGEQWTDLQRRALERLAVAAEADGELGEQERHELAETLRKSLFRMSVRQSHKRLLTSLGLIDLWKPWDKLYGHRSEILHGLTYSNNADRSQIVAPALSLCARIVLTAMDGHVPGAAERLDEMFPLPA